MIIDSHVHFGKALQWDMKQEDIIKAVELYNIDYVIVSNIAANEFDHKLNKLPDEIQVSQIEANQKTVDFVKKYPDKIKGLFWIKPHLEGYTKEVEEFIENNRDYICGIKVHPYHSNLAFTVENYKDFLEMAVRLNMPIAVHTAVDPLSNSKNVYEVAKVYKDVNFILVHMDLGGDHIKPMEYIKELPNLYGDTTWVNAESALKAVKECGSHKIMFGTDAIIDGVDTYQKYEKLISCLRNNLSEEDFNNVFSKTAQILFKL
jgi:predicted TIM-barrel fold metal-dependent hydrolase